MAGSPAIVSLLLALTFACTLVTFSLMNHWQRFVTATEAGLIYCAEPLWASLFSLWLPGILTFWTGAAYANEHATTRLLLGGGLITLANVGLQLRPQGTTPVR
jgi:drug/metabolite transporter (DMT)-like permease